jgi:hypothetical protein
MLICNIGTAFHTISNQLLCTFGLEELKIVMRLASQEAHIVVRRRGPHIA